MAKFDIEKVKVYVNENYDHYDVARAGWYDITFMVTDEVKQEFVDVLDAVDDMISSQETIWAEEYVKRYGEPLFTWDSARYSMTLSKKIANYVSGRQVNNFILRMKDGDIYGAILHGNKSQMMWASKNIKFVYENK